MCSCSSSLHQILTLLIVTTDGFNMKINVFLNSELVGVISSLFALKMSINIQTNCYYEKNIRG